MKPKSFRPDSFEPDPPEPPHPPKPDKPSQRAHTPPRFYETPPEPGFFFPGKQAEYHENQVRDLEAKIRLHTAKANYGAHLEENARRIDHEMDTLESRLHDTEESRQLTHEINKIELIARKGLIAHALENKTDVTTHNQIRLLEETGRIRLADRNQEIDQDVKKAERMASIDYEKEHDLMKLYIWTSRVEKMFDKEIQTGLQEKIFAQIDVIAKLRKLPLSDSRTTKLAVAQTVLNAWVKELDELTRGRKESISGGNEEEHRGLEAPTEPPASTQEDD